ncbi:MAG TPA: hypothetical protein ENK18_22150 [Deltaproteobacteria bacterium]|nr:hypothetical protein [Deltaproteobacteria bacterium]
MPRDRADPSEALETHITFFDVDRDGEITRDEIHQGLEELGFSPLVATVLAPVLAIALPRRVEDLLEVRHDDTGAFTSDGAFDEDAFEAWWRRTDRDGDGRLSRWELLCGSVALADDPISLGASVGELQLLHHLLAEDGGLSRASVLRFLDGSWFAELIARRDAQSSP